MNTNLTNDDVASPCTSAICR